MNPHASNDPVADPPPNASQDAPGSRQRPLPEALASAAFKLLQVLDARAPDSGRPNPSATGIDAAAHWPLSDADRARSVSMMRVNDAGEVAAQGLYDGQVAFARTAQTSAQLDHAAREEADHLRWCRQRLGELEGKPSLFNPLWYGGAFALGGVAALLGDRASFGFLAETERQVVEHLDGHLDQLPVDDVASRAIVSKMLDDEAQHRDAALDSGGGDLPLPLRGLMRFASKVMIHTASRV